MLFHYQDSTGVITRRDVQNPKDDGVYIRGYDLTTKGHKTFRKDQGLLMSALANITFFENAETRQDGCSRVIKALLDRLGYRELNRLLSEQDLSLRSSDPVDITSLASKLADSANWGKLEFIWEEYQDNTLFGEKAVSFYRVSPRLMESLISFFSTYPIEDNVLSNSYPLPIPDAVMDTLDKTIRAIPIPIAFHQELHAMVFGSIRFFTKQERYDIPQINSHPQLVDDISRVTRLRHPQSLEGYDEVVLKKHELKQFFDAIILHPTANLIQIIVDSPDTQDQSQTKQQVLDTFTRLYEWLARLSHNLIEDDDVLPAYPLNLFPAVAPLCRTQGEGLLKMYAFVTNTALEDQPSAKATERKKDLRTDQILRNGEVTASEHAITIEIYKTLVAWPQYDRASPAVRGEEPYVPFLELALLGAKPRTTGRGTRSLEYAIIKGARSFSDYQFLCRKLFTYLDHDY